MRIVEKPWGREIWWAQTSSYVGKRIEVRGGNALSLQYHREKLETMYFERGEGELTLGDTVRPIPVGEAVTIIPGTVHRIRAVSDVVIWEVSTPQVEDVVRLADEYGRGGAGGGKG